MLFIQSLNIVISKLPCLLRINVEFSHLANFMEGLKEKREWLIEMGRKKTDEAKRPGKPKSSRETFGMEGSFRSLTID